MKTLRNRVQLIGNLGNDPEIFNTDAGKKIAKFNIATNEVFKNSDGDKETNTEWHRVVCFGKTADIVESYLTKGKEVAIEGKLTHNSWEDKDGNKRYSTDVVCNELLMLGK